MKQETFNQIREATDTAIQNGLFGANSNWREETMQNLESFCMVTEEFTMNDFRDFNVRNCRYKTHDNRAMGGIVKTATKNGWIEPTGRTIMSKVGHKSLLQIWKSNLFSIKNV